MPEHGFSRTFNVSAKKIDGAKPSLEPVPPERRSRLLVDHMVGVQIRCPEKLWLYFQKTVMASDSYITVQSWSTSYSLWVAQLIGVSSKLYVWEPPRFMRQHDCAH
jgi:hypothetical protein